MLVCAVYFDSCYPHISVRYPSNGNISTWHPKPYTFPKNIPQPNFAILSSFYSLKIQDYQQQHFIIPSYPLVKITHCSS
ncbi:hypothetical protein HanHA300_Chr03g0077811 [Helianthus annuus]|nr:hypothetical protein HanHA300_Chr03g0077811 [Helianthus annuus]KAJ0772715.1 hypothetical protein HanOQP8_Chr03g0090581 [Helianthus annuus]KAJ0942229.1 hypothetical protein HanPSC8_Chr03g0089491 [Helianthus annuus]